MRKLALCKHTAAEWIFVELIVVQLDHFNHHQSCASIASSNDAFCCSVIVIALVVDTVIGVCPLVVRFICCPCLCICLVDPLYQKSLLREKMRHIHHALTKMCPQCSQAHQHQVCRHIHHTKFVHMMLDNDELNNTVISF